MRQLLTRLFTPVDNGPLVLFRVIFGLLLFLESAGAIFTGWVTETFIDPRFNFTFIGFEWLQPLPGVGMYFYYAAMSGFGLLVMIGLYYRLSISMYTIMWTASYLMQKTHYNNHYYLLILLCIFMILCPAHTYFSLDSRRDPTIRSYTCPAWCYWIFIAQLLVVYEAAAFSKIYPDWLDGAAVRIWYNQQKDFPLLGGLFQERWWHLFVAYGGIVFDGLIIPGLLWRRTRNLAFAISIPFHLHNSAVFQIGIFPYLMIATVLFFYPPGQINRIFFTQKPVLSSEQSPVSISDPQKYLLLTFALYLAIQIWLPLRHHAYPGNVHWTEEGHRLAWKMMLRAKWGFISFKVVNPESGETFQIEIDDYLTDIQKRQMATRPDMIWQFVQYLKQDLTSKGYTDPEIYASSRVWLNGRPEAPLIDPQVDLAQVKWKRFSHSDWILPLPVWERPSAKK